MFTFIVSQWISLYEKRHSNANHWWRHYEYNLHVCAVNNPWEALSLKAPHESAFASRCTRDFSVVLQPFLKNAPGLPPQPAQLQQWTDALVTLRGILQTLDLSLDLKGLPGLWWHLDNAEGFCYSIVSYWSLTAKLKVTLRYMLHSYWI